MSIFLIKSIANCFDVYYMEIAQISLITEEIPDKIPKLLEERDILVNMEEGTNSSISISKYNEQQKITVDLEKYINLML